MNNLEDVPLDRRLEQMVNERNQFKRTLLLGGAGVFIISVPMTLFFGGMWGVGILTGTFLLAVGLSMKSHLIWMNRLSWQLAQPPLTEPFEFKGRKVKIFPSNESDLCIEAELDKRSPALQDLEKSGMRIRYDLFPGGVVSFQSGEELAWARVKWSNLRFFDQHCLHLGKAISARIESGELGWFIVPSVMYVTLAGLYVGFVLSQDKPVTIETTAAIAGALGLFQAILIALFTATGNSSSKISTSIFERRVATKTATTKPTLFDQHDAMCDLLCLSYLYQLDGLNSKVDQCNNWIRALNQGGDSAKLELPSQSPILRQKSLIPSARLVLLFPFIALGLAALSVVMMMALNETSRQEQHKIRMPRPAELGVGAHLFDRSVYNGDFDPGVRRLKFQLGGAALDSKLVDAPFVVLTSYEPGPENAKFQKTLALKKDKDGLWTGFTDGYVLKHKGEEPNGEVLICEFYANTLRKGSAEINVQIRPDQANQEPVDDAQGPLVVGDQKVTVERANTP